VTVARIPPLGDDPPGRDSTAIEHLSAFIYLYDRGMREPLPLACEASAAYAQAVANGKDGVLAADKAWTSTFEYPKEDRQPEHVLVHGGEIALVELMSQTPRDDEDWNHGETTRFGRYARRLWDGLLDREVIGDR
jgi:exodeoxyribonuclease V gamma subunit